MADSTDFGPAIVKAMELCAPSKQLIWDMPDEEFDRYLSKVALLVATLTMAHGRSHSFPAPASMKDSE